MKHIFCATYAVMAALALPLMGGCTSKSLEQNSYNQGIHIIPMPVSLVQKNNVEPLALHQLKSIVAPTPELHKIATYLVNKLQQSTGTKLEITTEATGKPSEIRLNLVSKDSIPQEEGYTLESSSDLGVSIHAQNPRGIFWGVQSFLQLFPAEVESKTVVKGINWMLPAVRISDYPRFPYRGQHVDVSRHFLPVETIKKTIDVLAMLKINTLHFHLVDDQGWRIEIKKYPRLTTVGAGRVEGDGTIKDPQFYTQEQIRDIVAYAQERYVDVIPEIELPGHSVAALTAYPELGCHGADYPYEVRNIWGVSTELYCAGKDEVFTFLKDVIDEVLPLFPSQYFHIGGDEADKYNWLRCSLCAKRMKTERLKDVHELQSWFIQQIESYLLEKGKKMIGWEEILEGGLAPSAIVMSWTGEEGGIKSANMGHDVILTPASKGYYLDHYQGDHNVEPLAIGGYSTLERVYAYNPMPEAISLDKRHHVLGVQANLWSEYFYTPEHYEYMSQPRMAAVAEVAWSPLEVKSYENFLKRLNNLLVRYDQIGYNYFIPQPEQGDNKSTNHVVFTTDTITIPFTTVYPVAHIRYTTDGTEPTLSNGKEYTEPLKFTESTTLRIRSIIESGKMSPIREIKIEKQTLAPAVAELTNDYVNGITLSRLDKKFANSDELLATPKDQFLTVNIANEPQIEGSEIARTKAPMYTTSTKDHSMSNILWTGMIYSGYINVPEDGVYRFHTTNHRLWIDDILIIDNEGWIKKNVRTDHMVALAKGLHKIKWAYITEIKDGWPTPWNDVRIGWACFDKNEPLAFITDEYFYSKREDK